MSGEPLLLVHIAATALLNLAFSAAIGILLSHAWLGSMQSNWAQGKVTQLKRLFTPSIIVAIFAASLLLWLEAADMAEVPLLQASDAISALLKETHFGHAWLAGAVTLAATIAISYGGLQRRSTSLTIAFALGAYAYTRVVASHAVANGDFSWTAFTDWMHLVLMGVWAGEVFVAALCVLAVPTTPVALNKLDWQDQASYAHALSKSASLALGGIVLTGILNACFELGSIEKIAVNPYGNTLLLKLAFVSIAVMLGGCNRFLVMPAMIRALSTAAPTDTMPVPPTRRFATILKWEGVVLSVVLVIAAVLASTSPPAA